MVKVHMKSGKTHLLDIAFGDFEDMLHDEETDAVCVRDVESELNLHVIPKDNIESLQVTWHKTMAELDELVKNSKIK